MNPDLIEELKVQIKGDIDVRPDILKVYSKDASICTMMPKVIIYPKDTKDVSAVVRFVAENKTKNPDLSITVRGAGTDMSGGAIGESIILDMTRYMKGIVEWKGNSVRLKPGTFFRDLENVAEKRGLFLPSFPASHMWCTVGGVVANNAGGEKTLVYGQTIRYVKELKLILSDGNEYTVAPLTRMELERKIAKEDFEGDFYRHLHYMISKNSDLIRRNKPRTKKNSSGYYLWDVWVDEYFDLSKLFVGSQGTLGVITEIVFELVKKPKEKRMLTVFLKEIKPVSLLVNEVLTFSPESIESYDEKTVKLAVKYFPDLIRGKNFKEKVSMFVKFLPEFICFFFYGFPKMIVIIEFGGEKVIDVEFKINELRKRLLIRGFHVHKVSSDTEAKKYWMIRRESYNLLRKHSEEKQVAPFIEDIIVPVENLNEFIPKLDELLNSYNLNYSIAGHAGSGNFHIFPLMNFSYIDHKKIILDISEKVYDLVASYGGSITAEHNDGIIRTPFLSKIFSPEMIGLFYETKKIFDPLNIFNPMKKVGATKEYLRERLKTS